MNTMYAAVARRSADIGMLRMLGFSRAGILASFLVESLVLSTIGGVLGLLGGFFPARSAAKKEILAAFRPA